jgi:predicted O-methyltransferase YrrM
MERKLIGQKLTEFGVDPGSLILGDFDALGEITAKKARSHDSPMYKHGKFFRANYERGILMYNLVKQFKISTFLEVGTGRGYVSFCVAKAMFDFGIPGKIVTIDPDIEKQGMEEILKFIPQEWWSKISFAKGTSQAVLGDMNDNFELVFIDGAHDYESVLHDWTWAKEHFTKFCIFDDYFMSEEKRETMDIKGVVDNISDYDKELIITDRRIFHDDRMVPDDEIDYGQVIVYKESQLKTLSDTTGMSDWLKD